MGSGKDWNFLIGNISDCFRCVTIDLPGHGNSLLSDDSAYTMEASAQLVIEALDHLNILESTLVGYSMGGRLALYMGAHYSQRFPQVIIESASPGLRSPLERSKRKQNDERLARLLETESLERFLERWYAQPLFSGVAKQPELLARVKRDRLHNQPNLLAKSLRGMGTGSQPSLWGVITNYPSQLGIIVGSQDQKFQRIAGEMVTLNRSIARGVVKRAGHTAHLEEPEQFREVLLAQVSRKIRVQLKG